MINKYLVILLLSVVLILQACNKDENHSSLLGSWNCEELPEISTPANYQVNITRNNLLPDDSNQYVIYNFNQLGFEEERGVYFQQNQDGSLLITGTEIIGISITGNGTVANDFSKIEWTYKVDKGGPNENIIATYY